MKKTRYKETKFTDRYMFTREDLLEFISSKYELGLVKGSKVRLFVTVPCGGDYSGTELDLDKDTKLQMLVETETIESS